MADIRNTVEGYRGWALRNVRPHKGLIDGLKQYNQTILESIAISLDGIGTVSISCMTTSGTDDRLTPLWHASSYEWLNIVDSKLIPYGVQCLSQGRDRRRRWLQLTEPSFHDIPQMFNGVEVRTV